MTVRVRPAAGGPEETISCRYLVGCDGGRSLVRQQLGITYEGEEQETGFSSGLHPSKYLRIPNLAKSVIREPAWQYWLVRPGQDREPDHFRPVRGRVQDDGVRGRRGRRRRPAGVRR